MTRNRRYFFNSLTMVSLLVCLSLVSCGSYFAPGPTAKPVKPIDLVGKWYYSPLLDHDAKVTLDLNADMTFVQTVTRQNGTVKAKGTWSISASGSEVNLDGVQSGAQTLGAASETWTIIDSDRGRNGFAILGGADDPDLWVIFDASP